MPAQQIVAPPSRSGMFLTVLVDEGQEGAVKDLLTDMSSLNRAVGFRSPGDGLIVVTGIGAALWDRLFGGDTRPAQLHALPEIRGEKHAAVSTPGDLLFHIRAGHLDVCFEMAALIQRRLEGVGRVVDEVHGFKFYDDRDLLGFVDGTENPQAQAATDAVTIGDEDAAYAGGSYVVTQKYLHDMAGWRSLSIEQQEQAIGRTKLEDVEMADDVKPRNSHIALNVLFDDDGNQLQIFRENMPFGRVGDGEFGTFFIGYAKDPRITETMLRNMFVGRPEGVTDRILDFSTAQTGTLYFVPSAQWLDDPKPVARNGARDDSGVGNLPAPPGEDGPSGDASTGPGRGRDMGGLSH